MLIFVNNNIALCENIGQAQFSCGRILVTVLQGSSLKAPPGKLDACKSHFTLKYS